jgi:hypothetical protein
LSCASTRWLRSSVSSGVRSKTHLPEFRFFGFPVEEVGPHVDHIFHSVAADDRLIPFRETRVELTPEGLAMGQDLRQCWFGGWHTDIGGETVLLLDFDLDGLTNATINAIRRRFWWRVCSDTSHLVGCELWFRLRSK